jgi:predicted  nucleic acid-binding Zn-ribbon protein
VIDFLLSQILPSNATCTAAYASALQEQEDWRKSREEWEGETKSAFLALEQELKETVAKLDAAEAAAEGTATLERELADVTARAEAAAHEMKTAAAAAFAARSEGEAEKKDREAAGVELKTAGQCTLTSPDP